MAAITSAHEVSYEDLPSVRLAGSAVPFRKQRLFLKVDSTGATDTVDLNAVTGNYNINTVLGLVSAVKTTIGTENTLPNQSAGTATLNWGGTTLTTLGGAGTYKILVDVALR